MKRNRVIIMALRRMYSQGKGSVEKGYPSVEFGAVARSVLRSEFQLHFSSDIFCVNHSLPIAFIDQPKNLFRYVLISTVILVIFVLAF